MGFPWCNFYTSVLITIFILEENLFSPFHQAFICQICQAEYCVETDDPFILVCGHSMCSACLNHLTDFQSSISCPVCRKDTEADYFKNRKDSKNNLLKDLITKYKQTKHVKRKLVPLEEHKYHTEHKDRL